MSVQGVPRVHQLGQWLSSVPDTFVDVHINPSRYHEVCQSILSWILHLLTILGPSETILSI